MFSKHDLSGFTTPLDRIRMKTLVHGDRTLMTEFRLEQGAVLPRHKHRHEQTGYLVSGRIEMVIGAEAHQVSAGDSWCIPGDREHHAVAREDSVALEDFSPVREDYLRQRS